MASYYLIQPVTSEPETATIIGHHRTRDAAEAARAKANRKLRRQPGMATSWVPWEIVPAEKLSATKRAAFRGRK